MSWARVGRPITRPEKIELEKTFQGQLMEAIRSKFGPNVWIYKTNDVQVGIPNLIICFFGHFVAVEIKRANIPTSRAKPAYNDPDLTNPQRSNIIKINKAGGSAFVGREIFAVVEKLEKIQVALQMLT